jgi:hypothetical protein
MEIHLSKTGLIDLRDFRPASDSLADLMAALKVIEDWDSANTAATAEMYAQLKDRRESGSMVEIGESEGRIAEADLNCTRLSGLAESLKAKLPAARRAAAAERTRSLVRAADAKLAEATAELAAYPAAAATIAKICQIYREHAALSYHAARQTAIFLMDNPGIEVAYPVSALARYDDLISLPGVALPGDDGNDAARKRFWPPPAPPASASPPAPPRDYGPSRAMSEVRLPRTPTPPAAHWGLTPDWDAP